MAKMGHLLAVPEQTIWVYNGYMMHNMKPLKYKLHAKAKKKIQSPIWHILDSNRGNQPL